MNVPVFYWIIPCYNEEQVIGTTAARVTEKLQGNIDAGRVSAKSRICLVDDGSTDRTWELLVRLYETNDKIIVLRHNRNYGEQYAYLTGIRFAADHADCMITMDADLQDDIDASDEMLDAYAHGMHVAYGVRRRRDRDSRFQRMTSTLFYRFMRLCGTELVAEHSQYRMMSREAAKNILDHMELKVFLPALVPLLHLPGCIVYYDRAPRAGGESHYNVRSLARLASNAILSYGVYLPFFLLLFAVLDAALGIAAAVFLHRSAQPTPWIAVMPLCFSFAVVLLAAFLFTRREMRQHLRAKNRPTGKKPTLSDARTGR